MKAQLNKDQNILKNIGLNKNICNKCEDRKNCDLYECMNIAQNRYLDKQFKKLLKHKESILTNR